MKKILTLLSIACIAALFHGCESNDDLKLSATPLMIKPAAPVLVNTTDTTFIELADYFQSPGTIDSLFMAPELTWTISPDSTRLAIVPRDRNFPRLSVMEIWSKGFSYSLLLERSTKVRYRFTFDPGRQKYRRVQLAGQMNEWNAGAGNMFEKDKKWHIDLNLFPGKYQYKLVTDGRWRSDPNCRDSITNYNNGFNSLLVIGALNTAGLPQLFTATADGRTLTVGLRNSADTLFVLWQNHLLGANFVKRDSNGITVTVPRAARKFDRSFIRVWAMNGNGISNDLLIPLKKGKVITDAGDLSRTDQEAMVMYFAMVDRFRNGDKGNDAPVKDPEIDPRVNYMGGDLAGITRAIEDGYFTRLGINTLWISPITQNPTEGFREYPAPHRKFSGYHGYWPITLTTVDHRFGDGDDLRRLVAEAHSKGINVILDFVAHHVHQDYAMLAAHPDWITKVDLPGKRKNIRLWDEQRLTTWFDIFLPTFDLTKPEVAEMVSDSAAFWIKRYGLDGFRHDAAKHVPESFWRLLTAKLNRDITIPEERFVYQIGETFGSRELVKRYINPGMLDGQFEFNLYWDARAAFTIDNASFRELNYSLQQSFNYYGYHHLMGNITGNQDLARFISYASGALSYNEDANEAGWKRTVEVKDTMGYRRLASMIAFNMTVPGIPVIYYGDEIGMAGAGDPDNRRMMRFDSLNRYETYLKETTTALTKLRRDNLALTYGDFATLKAGEKQFVYLRSYFDKAIIVVFNKDKSARKVSFELPERFAKTGFSAMSGNQFSLENNTITMTPEGHSFEILISK